MSGTSPVTSPRARADYIGLLGAEAVGCLTTIDVRRRVVEAANSCMVRRDGRPLASATNEGDLESLYACSMTAMYLVDAAVGSGSGTSDGAPQVFTRVFQTAWSRGGPPTYGTYDLLEATHMLAADAAAVVPLERLLHVGINGSVERYFRDVLRDAGLAVDLVAPSEATLRPRDVAELLQAQLARCSCTSDCDRADPIDADADAVPVTVSGIPVFAVPTAALDELAKRTAQGAPVEVERPHGQ